MMRVDRGTQRRMSSKSQSPNRITENVYRTAKGLHDAGAISKKTLHEFEDLCSLEAPSISKQLQLLQKLGKLKFVFLPIKPIYAQRLMEGSKRFEFRRRPFSSDVTHIVVYASSPYKRILGIVEVDSIKAGSASAIWKKTKESAGIDRQEFFSYFAGASTAYAIAIKPSKTLKFANHVSPKEIEEDFVVPQSFKYLEASFMRTLLSIA